MDLAVEVRDSTRWGLGDGTVAAAAVDTGDVGGQPCRRVALGVVEVEERSPSEERSSVSEVFGS
jgi:hypothetical protein